MIESLQYDDLKSVMGIMVSINVLLSLLILRLVMKNPKSDEKVVPLET